MTTLTPNTSDDKALRQMLAAEVKALSEFQQRAQEDLARELAQFDAEDAATHIIDLDQPGGHPLPSLSASMVFLGDEGLTDRAAYHRAIAICHALVRLSYWNGRTPIRVINAYAIHESRHVTLSYDTGAGEWIVRKAEKPQGEE